MHAACIHVAYTAECARIFCASTELSVLQYYSGILCGPGSSDCIATDYGLDGPGSNPGGD